MLLICSRYNLATKRNFIVSKLKVKLFPLRLFLFFFLTFFITYSFTIQSCCKANLYREEKECHTDKGLIKCYTMRIPSVTYTLNLVSLLSKKISKICFQLKNRIVFVNGCSYFQGWFMRWDDLAIASCFFTYSYEVTLFSLKRSQQ